MQRDVLLLSEMIAAAEQARRFVASALRADDDWTGSATVGSRPGRGRALRRADLAGLLAGITLARCASRTW
jgi:hypothetical protein